mgnify:CR=1 FL=1
MWGCVLSELVITYLRLLKDCSLLLIVCFVLFGNFLQNQLLEAGHSFSDSKR